LSLVVVGLESELTASHLQSRHSTTCIFSQIPLVPLLASLVKFLPNVEPEVWQNQSYYCLFCFILPGICFPLGLEAITYSSSSSDPLQCSFRESGIASFESAAPYMVVSCLPNSSVIVDCLSHTPCFEQPDCRYHAFLVSITRA
jgi:hypothetical protein